ncbi:MAG: RNA polymerase sigma factor [Anaerolineae bacterium]|nr:RNA polymerase sigma factor [Anaerolineae bacterium]
MERTNEQWLAHLDDGSLHQAEAIEDLRQYLQRAVMVYLRSRSDLSHLAESELQHMGQDYVQDALLKIRTGLDSFRGKSKFTTWAAKIAANHTISELRRARWRDLSLDAITETGTSLQEVLAFDSGPGSNPDSESERRHVWQAITQVVNHDLTDRQRQVLMAVRIDDIPMAEVARLLDTNINNIYKLLHDARLKLKRGLQQLGWDPAYILRLFSEDE